MSDSKTLVNRYMTDDRTQRVIGFTFATDTPADELDDDTIGELTFSTRYDPSDVWNPPHELKNTPSPLTLADYRQFAESQGFAFEELNR